MIRVVRTPEPSTLTRARRRRLVEAITAYDRRGAGTAELTQCLRGYDVAGVKRALFAAQHKKCAWCERRRDFAESPVEHYRPKDGAWRNLPGQPRRVSATHYWWLTWTWENLLFACPRCNGKSHKGNYFPLTSGTAEARPAARPIGALASAVLPDVGGEHPLLLDPAADDFLDHVRWEPGNTTQPRELWTWTPRARTDRGAATIAILKLDELADEFERHLLDHVLPRVETVEQHLRGRRTVQARNAWTQTLRLLERDRSFTAATWCALSRWTNETCDRHGLPRAIRPR